MNKTKKLADYMRAKNSENLTTEKPGRKSATKRSDF